MRGGPDRWRQVSAGKTTTTATVIIEYGDANKGEAEYFRLSIKKKIKHKKEGKKKVTLVRLIWMEQAIYYKILNNLNSGLIFFFKTCSILLLSYKLDPYLNFTRNSVSSNF